MENNWGHNDMLVVCSFRYSIGRRSYLPGTFLKWMKENWDEFIPQTKELIKNEIRQELVKGLHQNEWEQTWEDVLDWSN